MNTPLKRLAVFALVSISGLLVGWRAQPSTSAVPPATKPSTASYEFIPQGRLDNKGWMERHESFNTRSKQAAEKGDIDLIFLGDSITQGWEGEGKEVWTKYYASRNAVNYGIGGDRTEHVVWRAEHGNFDGLAKPKAGHAPKLVVLMIGTNNSGTDTPEQIGNGVKAVMSALRVKLPTTKILVLSIFPRSETPDATREKIAAVNTIIAQAADDPLVEVLDIGPKFVKPDGTIDKAIMPDFLHLSKKGYEIWADAIEPTVKRMLGE